MSKQYDQYEVCGLCVKNLRRSVSVAAEKLRKVLEAHVGKRDYGVPKFVAAIRAFTDSLENILVWSEAEEIRENFLFSAFGPRYLYGNSDGVVCIDTHLNTKYMWYHWKHLLARVIESGTASFINPGESRTISSFFWERLDKEYTGWSATFLNGTVTFTKCDRCKDLVEMPSYVQAARGRLGRGLVTTQHIFRGTRIFQFAGKVLSDEESTAASLQIDNDKFLESKNIDNFLNHSCAANCYIEWDTMWLRAGRDIDAGEELTYDYNTSDWDNLSLKRKEPAWFICECHSEDCLGKMLGFKHLSKDEQTHRLGLAAPYIKKNLEKRF